MRIVLPGGSGQIGTILARHLHAQGHDITVLSRRPRPAAWRTAYWNATTPEIEWTRLIDGADAIINLAGRSVNCRFTPEHRKEILESRAHPTFLLGQVIESAQRPPRIWLNASTATVYRHSLDTPQNEETGEFGGEEPDAPARWAFSVDVGRQWEHSLYGWPTRYTRKVALRTSLVMSSDPGGVFSVLLNLVHHRLGGTQGPGDQMVSWIHEQDFVHAVDFLLKHEISGPVNMTSPYPVQNRDFMRVLRKAAGVRLGVPSPGPLLTLGALVMQTETELVLKSRYVVPGVLMQHGFDFQHPTWSRAAHDLVRSFRLRSVR